MCLLQVLPAVCLGSVVQLANSVRAYMASACCFSVLAFLCSTRVIYSLADLQCWSSDSCRGNTVVVTSDVLPLEWLLCHEKCILGDRDLVWEELLSVPVRHAAHKPALKALCCTNEPHVKWVIHWRPVVTCVWMMCFHHSHSSFLWVQANSMQNLFCNSCTGSDGE